MEAWIEFGRGPLFRLAFCLMVLGLIAGGRAHDRRNRRSLPAEFRPDRALEGIARQTAGLAGAGAAACGAARPVYSVDVVSVSMWVCWWFRCFWPRTCGCGAARRVLRWPALPQGSADYLTLLADRRRTRPVLRPRSSPRRPGAQPAAGLFLAAAAGCALRDRILLRATRRWGRKVYQDMMLAAHLLRPT